MSLNKVCIALSLLVFTASAQSQDDATEAFYRGDDEMNVRSTQPVRVAAPAPPSTPPPPPVVEVRPQERPVTLRNGQGGQFTQISNSDRSRAFFKKFETVFKQCTLQKPGYENCNAGQTTIYRKDADSCHNTAEAIDFHALICGQTKYTALAGSRKFKDFVNCIDGKSSWKKIYQQTHGNCGDPEKRNVTTCHYDHVHFSMGCKVRGI